MTVEKITITPALEAKVRQWHADGVPAKRISENLGISAHHVRKITDQNYAARMRANEPAAEKPARKISVKKPVVEIPSIHILDLHASSVSITRIAALTRQPYRVVIDVIERAGAAR